MGDQVARRQHHRKSRQGCSSCKARHIKCDEEGPPCANCRVRKVQCSYAVQSEPTVSPNESPMEVEYQGATNTATATTTTTTTDNRRLEMELLHQWSTSTYHSLVFQSENATLWQITIPRIALDNDYLLHALLSLSALQLAAVSAPPYSKTYQLATLNYHTRAVAAFQSHDRRTTPSTHQPLFAFSIVNLVIGVALQCCLDRQFEKCSILDTLSTTFSLLQGTTSIHRMAKRWLEEGSFGPYVRANANMPTTPLEPREAAVFGMLRALRDEEYAAVLGTAEHALDAVRAHALTTEAIATLESCFANRSEDTMVVCFRWLALLDEEFARKIFRREPLALLLTAHWAVLLDRLGKEKWWAKASGKALVAEITGLLGSVRPEWGGMLSWVNTEVGLPPL